MTPLEAVIATEVGDGQLQSGVWQTLRKITGQTPSSRTLFGRFLFEEVELLQVLMAARSRQCLCRAVLALEHRPNLPDIRRRGDHEAFQAELVNRRRQMYPLDPYQLNSQLADAQKATGEALFDMIVEIINDKEDHPNVHLELT